MGLPSIYQSTPSAQRISNVLPVSQMHWAKGLSSYNLTFLEYVYMANALPSFDMPASAKLTKFLKEQDQRKPAFKKAVEKAMAELAELVVSPIEISGRLVLT